MRMKPLTAAAVFYGLLYASQAIAGRDNPMEDLTSKVRIVTSQNQQAKDRPLMVFIPGGPGLSSATLSNMEILSRSFDLAFYDPQGTGGQEEPEDQDFNSVVSAIEVRLMELNRPVVLVAHSFATLYTTEIVLYGRLKVSGLVFLAGPLTQTSLDTVDIQYEKHRTPELNQAENEWESCPSLDTFHEWMFQCLFFSEKNKEKGRKLILEDKSSWKHFYSVRSGWNGQSNREERLRAIQIPKLLIAGGQDKILPPETLRNDAKNTGCEFYLLKEAGHFPTLDEPEAVARLIENKFSDKNIGELK